jgi:hypothetical protein
MGFADPIFLNKNNSSERTIAVYPALRPMRLNESH